MMEPFYAHFPKVAPHETRTVTVICWGCLPPDEYAFIEMYCTKESCTCRNVILNVVSRRGSHLATINHALDPDGFKDVSLPDMPIGQTFLDPLNPQSRHSKDLMELFKERVLDDIYAERLERHLRMMKEKINTRRIPPNEGRSVL